jgi:prevent-host-death family protein
MKAVTAAEFQAQCSQLIKEVVETGSPVVIVDNGQPVAQLGPIGDQTLTLMGAHRGKIRVIGDLIEPIGGEWEAER